jgi:glycosyltransferase involved in cell wall biosynthesis
MQQAFLETDNCKEQQNSSSPLNSNDFSAPIKVLMMGPSLRQQGGMATVENLILRRINNNIQIQHITTHEEGTAFHRVLIFCFAIGKFLLFLLKGDCDLVHLHVSERGSVFRICFLTLVARLFRKSVIIHAHGCEFHQFYDSLPPLLQKYISSVFRQCACFFVLSRSWRDYYINRCALIPERTVVFTNPVDFPEKIPDRSDRDKITLLFLGRVGQRKGAFDLLQAFANLPDFIHERSKLTLAGDGDVEEAENLAELLKIKSLVSIPGWLSQEECKKMLAQADVFILPSYNEAMPMAVLEAMSWGLPVISTRVGGVPEIVTPGKTGTLVAPGDINEIKDAIQFLIENKAERIAWGLAGRRCVAPLAIENYSCHLAEVYRKAVAPDKLTYNDFISMPSINLDEI